MQEGQCSPAMIVTRDPVAGYRLQVPGPGDVSVEDMTALHAPTINADKRSPSDRALPPNGSTQIWSSTLNRHCRMGAESPSFEPPEPRPTGSGTPEGMTAMGVVDTMGHPEAQEDREQSGHMGGYEVAPMGHPGETPSPGVTAHLTSVSVRPYRHDTQLVPARGSDNVAAEASGLMDNRLSSVFVPASPSECAVSTGLCLPRSGAPALAGDRRDDDSHTHAVIRRTRSCGGQPLASLQIPSDWGTQRENQRNKWKLQEICHKLRYLGRGKLSQNW